MLDFLWHNIWAVMGLGGVIVILLFAVAYFIPQFRLIAIEAAAGFLAATAIYAKGASDANARRKALEQKAEDNAVASGKAARTAADADAARGVKDGFDTDKP
jgi:hypothetical protein